MWVEVKKARSLALAEMWKELFEGEGIPTRLLPLAGGLAIIIAIYRHRETMDATKIDLMKW
ncbi:hypothetical protein ES703_75300 [subsurface metagenome]